LCLTIKYTQATATNRANPESVARIDASLNCVLFQNLVKRRLYFT